MNTILITGANGFLGKSLNRYFSSKGYNTLACTRQELDVSNPNKVKNFLQDHSVDIVLHTAVKGGRRNHKDNPEDYVTNLKMFNNLLNNKDQYSILINFGSGAEFDRARDISNFEESRIYDQLPSDYYGRSKNVISRKIVELNEHLYNFRLFGCFGKNEEENRLIKVLKSGIEKNTEVTIDAKKEMDFFYDQDVCRAIGFYISNFKKQDLPRDVNLTYPEKFNLKQISDIVENRLGSHNPNLILKNEDVKNYTGSSKTFNKTFPRDIFVGFIQGLNEVCK
jgi:GDP-L-fucose synthase